MISLLKHYIIITCIGTGCSNGPMPGFDFDLYLSPLLTNGSYSKYIRLQTIQSCLVKSHFQFNNFTRINSVSLLSDCLALCIGELKFTELPLKLTLYPEVTPTIPNRITTVLLEARINSPITIGNFITMTPNPTSDLQSILFSDDDDILCMLPSVNVSLFDTHITTPIRITELGLQFASSLSLFHIGTTSVMGQAGTDRPWDSLRLMLSVVFMDKFNAELTSYLNTELDKDIQEALQHIDTANSTYILAAKRVSQLKQKLMRLHNEFNDIKVYLDNNQTSFDLKQKERNLHEEYLYNFLEEYWNATDSLRESINSVCQIEECERICKRGIVPNLCFSAIRMKVYRKCNIYSTREVTVHTEQTEPMTIRECGSEPNLGFGEFIGQVLTLWTLEIFSPAKRKIPCRERVVYDLKWRSTFNRYPVLVESVCPFSSIKKDHDNYTCDYVSPCATYEVDPVCDARNEICYSNRTNIVADFNIENEKLRSNIRMRQLFYEMTLAQLLNLSSKVAILKLQNISITEEIKATHVMIHSAQKSAQIANQSLESIKASNSRIAAFNKNVNNFNFSVRVTNVYFDTTLETQTPVIVPLQVTYEMTHLKTSHQLSIIVDISATEDLIMKTIYNNIYDNIIDNIIGSSSRHRRNVIGNGTVSLVDIFNNNCDLQNGIVNYLNQLNHSLSVVQDDITQAVTVVNITRYNETASHMSTLEALTAMGTNLSLAMVVNERNIHAIQMEGYDLVVSEISDTKLSQWKADLDELHNETSNLFGQTCYSLIDCLSTSVINIRKLVSSLQAFNTSKITDNLKDAHKTVQELTNNTSWTINDIQYAVNKVYLLAIEVAEDGYWCATPPVLLDQPPSNIEEFVGNSLTLTCPSSSRLPVTYSWYKNYKSIPFATSSSLFLPFLTRADEDLYQCEVKNAIGTTKSNPTLLRVYKRVKITKQPESVKAVKNENVYFTCGADGYPLPKYQWMYRKSSDDIWTMVHDVNEKLLIINNISYADEGQYRCKAINDYSNAYSRQASLTLLPGTYPKLSYNFSLSFNSIKNITVITLLKDSFITAIGNLINTNLTPVHLTSAIITNNQLMISFVLFSSNYSIQSEADSYEAWFNQTITDLGRLQASKMIIDSSLHNNTHPFTIFTHSTKYIVNGKISTSPLVLDCPHGYQFDGSNLVCGKSFIIVYHHV